MCLVEAIGHLSAKIRHVPVHAVKLSTNDTRDTGVKLHAMLPWLSRSGCSLLRQRHSDHQTDCVPERARHGSEATLSRVRATADSHMTPLQRGGTTCDSIPHTPVVDGTLSPLSPPTPAGHAIATLLRSGVCTHPAWDMARLFTAAGHTPLLPGSSHRYRTTLGSALQAVCCAPTPKLTLRTARSMEVHVLYRSMD